MKDTSAHGIDHGVSQPVKVLAKAFLILEALQRSSGGRAGLKALAAALEMPKPTVFRILRTLETLGYLEYDPATQTYQATEELGQLGRSGLGSDLQRLTRLAMTRIAAEFGQTVNLAVLQAGHLIYRDVQEGPRHIRMSPCPGGYLSWTETALGKSILAFLPRDRAVRLLQLSSDEYAGKARQSLWAELGDIRSKGYAIDLEVSADGLCCVAAPILGPANDPVAALGISGSSSALTIRALPQIGVRLIEECAAVSAGLGCKDALVAHFLSFQHAPAPNLLSARRAS